MKGWITLARIAALDGFRDRLFNDPNLPPTPPPAPVPDPTPGKKKLTCENCGCQLTPDGDVFRMSTQAREWLQAAEDRDTARTERDEARQQRDELQRQLDAANAKIAKFENPETKSSFWDR